MSEIQVINKQMIEIWENYLDLISIFNDKLEEIKADDILNINLQLLKASITDLDINISTFKNEYQKYEIELQNNNKDNKDNKNKNNERNYHSNEQNINDENQDEINNDPGIDPSSLLALFFMYLMKIDKDSILNTLSPAQETYTATSLTSTTSLSSTSSIINSSSNNHQSIDNQSVNITRKFFDDVELD
jgi:hypothetical protein